MDADESTSKTDAVAEAETSAPSTKRSARNGRPSTRGRPFSRAGRSVAQLENAHLGLPLVAKRNGAAIANEGGEIVVADVDDAEVEKADYNREVKQLKLLSVRVAHATLLNRRIEPLDRGKMAVQIMAAARDKEVVVWDQRDKEDALDMEQKRMLIDEVVKWKDRMAPKEKQDAAMAVALTMLNGDKEAN